MTKPYVSHPDNWSKEVGELDGILHLLLSDKDAPGNEVIRTVLLNFFIERCIEFRAPGLGDEDMQMLHEKVESRIINAMEEEIADFLRENKYRLGPWN